MGKVDEPKLLVFPAGWSVKPLYDKCPCCGFDLNEFVKAPNKKTDADAIKKQTERSRIPGVVSPFKCGSSGGSWLHRFVKWMVNPLSNTINYAPETNQKSLFSRVVGKKASTIEKNNKSTNDD